MIMRNRTPGTTSDHDPVEAWLSTARAWNPEDAPTWVARLRAKGVPLPPPGRVPPDEFGPALSTLIHALATEGVYLAHTDHLTDEAAYRYLLETALAVPSPPRQPGDVEVIDLCPPYGPAIDTMLAVYASDDLRRRLRNRGINVPPRRPRAANRDAELPGPVSPPPGGP